MNLVEPLLGGINAGEADALSAEIAEGRVAVDQIAATQRLIFNNQIDAALTALFMVLVAIVVVDSARVWWRERHAIEAGPDAGPATDPAIAPELLASGTGEGGR